MSLLNCSHTSLSSLFLYYCSLIWTFICNFKKCFYYLRYSNVVDVIVLEINVSCLSVPAVRFCAVFHGLGVL